LLEAAFTRRGKHNNNGVYEVTTQFVASAVAAWIVPASVALADPWGGPWDHTMPMMGWGGWWFGLLMMGLAVLLVVLVIVGLWRLFSSGSASRSAAAPDRALDILRERFARGEIDEEEYEARKKALGG